MKKLNDFVYHTCDTFDKYLAEGANSLVKGWNYVTGKTKSDLACSLSYTADVMRGYATCRSPDLVFFSGFEAHTAWNARKMYRKTDKLEIDSMIQGAIEPELNDHQECYSTTALLYIALGIGLTTIPHFHTARLPQVREVTAWMFFGASHFFNSAASYVMRADSVQKGKSVLDRLDEQVESVWLALNGKRVEV
jgi:hypothetical protein